MERIRLGIVGLGHMAQQHFNGMTSLMDIADITAACDIIPENLESGARILSSVTGHEVFACTDYREMVDLIDAVLLVLPHQIHYEAGMFFAEHHKHILMEKPLCNTEEECLSLIETCEKNRLTLMCAYPVRYWPGVVKLKELVDSGKYGELFNMSIWTEQYTHDPNKPWQGRIETLGGGQLFSHGCHYIDILLWFLGNPLEGTHMGTNLGTPWMEREGTSNAIMKFESGAMGYHFGTWGARGTEHGYCFQLHLTKGMLDYHRATGKILFYENKNPDIPEDVPKEDRVHLIWQNEDHSKQTQFETRHFLECVRSGKRPLTDGRSSLKSLRCIWKMYEAEEKGRVADLRGLGLSEVEPGTL